MKSLLELLGDVILGGRCPYCSDRVFPKDVCAHRYVCKGRTVVRPRDLTAEDA